MKNLWTEEEIIFLENNAGNLSYKEMSQKINRTVRAINYKITELHLGKLNTWAEEEIDIIKNNILAHTIKELMLLLPNRSYNAIKMRIKILKIKRKKNSHWTKEEKDKLLFLVEMGHSHEEIAFALGRTQVAIEIKCARLGLSKERLWAEKECEILKKYYSTCKMSELINMLPGRNKKTLCRKARELGLQRRKIWTEEEIILLKQEYPNKLAKELKKIFINKTSQQIKSKAKEHHLKKNPEVFLKSIGSKDGKTPKQFDKMGSWRRKIINRDHFTCQNCGKQDESTISLRAHHIVPQRDVNCQLYDIDNGICLCKDCHDEIHMKEYDFIEKYSSIVKLNKTDTVNTENIDINLLIENNNTDTVEEASI